MIDYYELLGVSREATRNEIKAAYRKLVLQFHPDKHPATREKAETKIREINSAYEVLSNQVKKQQYDAQVLARDRKLRGFAPPSTTLSSRMAIPKEFLMQPIGYPTTFVRSIGSQLFAHTRDQVKHTDFYTFAQSAKFSLWWLPEVNNLCRLRAATSASAGTSGGLNVTHCLTEAMAKNLSEGTGAELVLQNQSISERTSFMCIHSSAYEGCFRFECFHYKGWYLGYRPPHHFKLVPYSDEEVVDFYLLNYQIMSKFITLEEVFVPVIKELCQESGVQLTKEGPNFMVLSGLKQHSVIQDYFANVLQSEIFDEDEFESYFHAHFDVFEYKKRKNKVGREEGLVRVRSEEEHLEHSLSLCKTGADVANLFSSSLEQGKRTDDEVLKKLNISTFNRILQMFCDYQVDDGDLKGIVSKVTAEKRLFMAIQPIVRSQGASLEASEESLNICDTIIKIDCTSIEELQKSKAFILSNIQDLFNSLLHSDDFKTYNYPTKNLRRMFDLFPNLVGLNLNVITQYVSANLDLDDEHVCQILCRFTRHLIDSGSKTSKHQAKLVVFLNSLKKSLRESVFTNCQVELVCNYSELANSKGSKHLYSCVQEFLHSLRTPDQMKFDHLISFTTSATKCDFLQKYLGLLLKKFCTEDCRLFEINELKTDFDTSVKKACKLMLAISRMKNISDKYLFFMANFLITKLEKMELPEVLKYLLASFRITEFLPQIWVHFQQVGYLAECNTPRIFLILRVLMEHEFNEKNFLFKIFCTMITVVSDCVNYNLQDRTEESDVVSSQRIKMQRELNKMDLNDFTFLLRDLTQFCEYQRFENPLILQLFAEAGQLYSKNLEIFITNSRHGECDILCREVFSGKSLATRGYSEEKRHLLMRDILKLKHLQVKNSTKPQVESSSESSTDSSSDTGSSTDVN